MMRRAGTLILALGAAWAAHAQPQPQQPANAAQGVVQAGKAAAASIGAPSAPGPTAAAVGELLQIEIKRALAEARRTSGAPEPVAAPMKAAPMAPLNTDLVELLGIYRQRNTFRADVAINGRIHHVGVNEAASGYRVKGMDEQCVVLIDPSQQDVTRCVARGS